ncbi:ATP-binding protein [Lentibacillus saliphilus]|uniref:ATP-binding protein n=1 Tax=Lentibacillus saliphilus TaxID=2737028 RepID=UPI001C30B47B|nr:ATP-binding protein [Lentibacillus saliphilus]
MRLNRDVLTTALSEGEELVIACDNSGSIGRKPFDDVEVDYEVVAYFAFRVAYMECAAAGATPFSVLLHNFNGDDAWDSLKKGIERGCRELNIPDLPVTGSTESNFKLYQSALGLAVLGKRSINHVSDNIQQKDMCVALIGEPLVGNDVLTNEGVAPLWLFNWCCHNEGIHAVIPVGSKGIQHELNQLDSVIAPYVARSASIDFQQSAGPATCFLILYDALHEGAIVEKAGTWFHRL